MINDNDKIPSFAQNKTAADFCNKCLSEEMLLAPDKEDINALFEECTEFSLRVGTVCIKNGTDEVFSFLNSNISSGIKAILSILAISENISLDELNSVLSAFGSLLPENVNAEFVVADLSGDNNGIVEISMLIGK